jgi:hypothetical protein
LWKLLSGHDGLKFNIVLMILEWFSAKFVRWENQCTGVQISGGQRSVTLCIWVRTFSLVVSYTRQTFKFCLLKTFL